MKNIKIRLTAFISFLLAITFSLNAQEEVKTDEFCVDSIKIIDITPFNYVAKEYTGSYSQQSAAYTSLWEESVKQFLDYDRKFFSVNYSSGNVPADSLRWDVGTRLNSDDDIVAPLVKKKWNFKKVAKFKFKGDIGSGLSAAFGKAYAHIASIGYTVSGPSYQRFSGRPKPNKDGVVIGEVEVWIPVKM